MRISDWSSDVCSSDLVSVVGRGSRLLAGDLLGALLQRPAQLLLPVLERLCDRRRFLRLRRTGIALDPELDRPRAPAALRETRQARDRQSTRLNSSHYRAYRILSPA